MIPACLRFICFPMVACGLLRVKMEKHLYLFSVYTRPGTVDWLNACHIDTPVVSPMGPQRHNGIAWLDATLLLSVSICPRLLILLLVDFTMLVILCDLVIRLKAESLVKCRTRRTQCAKKQHYSSVCFVLHGWLDWVVIALIIASPILPIMFFNGEYYPSLSPFIAICLQSSYPLNCHKKGGDCSL